MKKLLSRLSLLLAVPALALATLVPVFVASTASAATTGYPASDVLGQLDGSGNPDFTTNTDGSNAPDATNMSYPNGTTIDMVHHHLFVADNQNNRLLVYNLDSNNNLLDHTADYVLGQPNFTSADQNQGGSVGANTLSGPTAPYYDSSRSLLFVGDYGNNRVLIFDLSNGISTDMNAVHVLGQSDFTSSDSNQGGSLDANTLLGPYGGITFDPTSKYLYVSDSNNDRVLVYDTTTISNGMNASYVLGQPDFTSSTQAVTQSGLTYPYGLAIDSKGHKLFVADFSNNAYRVLVYNTAALSNGMNASNVLGPSDFTSSGLPADKNAPTASSMDPEMLAYDPVNQRLFVGDDADSRVLVFDVSNDITNGMNASAVVGVQNFTTNGYDNTSDCAAIVSRTSLCDTEGLSDYYDTSNNRLYVSDSSNNRIMIFDFAKLATTLNSAAVGGAFSQTLGSQTQGTAVYSVTAGALPGGMVLDASTGVLSGTPTKAGTFNFTIKLTDNNGAIGTFTDTRSYTLNVAPGTPDTGLAMISARPLITVTTTIVAVGMLTYTARRRITVRR